MLITNKLQNPMNIKKTMDKTMRKNQRVRVLRTRELGTVAEKVLIKRKGAQRPQLYCKVRLDKKTGEERWYWASQLGGTTEIATATIACEGQAVTINVTQNYETGNMSIEMTGSPENLKEHNRLHLLVATAIFVGLGLKPEDVETE